MGLNLLHLSEQILTNEIPSAIQNSNSPWQQITLCLLSISSQFITQTEDRQ